MRPVHNARLVTFTIVGKIKRIYTVWVLKSIFSKIFSFIFHHKKLSTTFLALLIVGFSLWPKPLAPVPTQEISAQDFVQSISVSGNVAAENTVNLSFPINGTIAYVGVKKGDIVNAYQVLANLDLRTVLKNLQNALLAYSIQRNTFDQTITNNGNPSDPSTAANDSVKRILQDNQYNLDQAVNSVELQNLAKQQSILTTPIAGIITEADPIAGQTAVLGTTLFTVVDPNSTVFDMDIDEADIGKISVGQEVDIVLDAYPDTTYRQHITKIDFVSHTTSNGSNAFSVETDLPTNTNYRYRVGMNGNADVILNKEPNTLTVPMIAVVNNTVWVKVKGGFENRKVVIGKQNDTDGIVVSGLSAGDVVALDPTAAAKEKVNKWQIKIH